jgi:hypothetical protein
VSNRAIICNKIDKNVWNGAPMMTGTAGHRRPRLPHCSILADRATFYSAQIRLRILTVHSMGAGVVYSM